MVVCCATKYTVDGSGITTPGIGHFTDICTEVVLPDIPAQVSHQFPSSLQSIKVAVIVRSHKIGSYQVNQVNQAKWLLGLQHQNLPLDRSGHTALQSHDVAAADIGGLTSSKLQRSTCGEQETPPTGMS